MRATVCLITLTIAAGCSAAPEKPTSYPDVSGYYFSQLENGPDTCPGEDWTPGETFPVDVVLSQQALALTVEVQYASTLGALVGAHTFSAELDDLQIVGSLDGDKSQTNDACEYTFAAYLAATVSLNTLSGTITYAAQTACAPVAGCTRVQTLSGERSPKGTQAPD